MTAKIQQIKDRYRYSLILLKELVATDFKLRYQNSFLGYVWSLLKPFFLFLMLYVVFVKILKAGADLPHFGAYLLLGVVMWTFFLETTSSSVTAIVGKGDLIRKVNFPKYVIVLAVCFSALINFMLNMVVVLAFMVMSKTDFQLSSIVFVPLLIVELFVFAMAISFLLSSLFVRFRDISFVWDVVTQAAFFITPIMYGFSLVTGASATAAKVLISNPLAQVMQDSRSLLVTNETITTGDVFSSGWYRLIPLITVLILTVTSVIYFRIKSPRFAEEV